MKNKQTMVKDRRFLLLSVGVVYFLIITVLFTRPLFGYLRTHMVGGYGDNVYFLWQIEWIRRAVFELKTMPLTSSLLNFPYGYSLLTTEIAPLQILFALPFALAGEPILGFNISMAGTFFIAGLAMSLWVYALTKSWWAAVISGTAYAFLPYHAAHFLIGHLNLSGIQWFPLYFWGFSAILTGKEFSKKHVLLMAFGLGAIALTSLYYIYMTLVITLIILVVYFAFLDRKKFLSKVIWKQLVLAGLISLPFLLVGVGPYVYFHASRGSMRSIEDAMIYSASLTDFLLPFTRQMILGKWVWKNFPRDLWNEATLYLGVCVSIFSIFGITERAEKQDQLVKIFLIGGIAAMILAMGVNVMWMEKPVWVTVPHWAAGIIHEERLLLNLPGYLFFKFMPFYSLMRVSMRYGIITMVFNCAAAGLGVHWLLKKSRNNWKNILALTILFMVILDFYNTPFPITEIKPREVDVWLAEQPEGGLVQLPFEQSLREENIYYTIHHNKPLLGAIRAFPSDRFLFLSSALNNFPDQASVDILREEGITYIVVDKVEIPIAEEEIHLAKDIGLFYEGSFSQQAVFTIVR